MSVVIHRVLLLIDAFFELSHAAENHYLFAGHLCGAGVHDSQLIVVRDVVDGLPGVLLDVERFDLLDVVEGELVADSRLWPEALASDDEDELIVELADAEGLASVLKVRQHDPFLACDGEELR